MNVPGRPRHERPMLLEIAHLAALVVASLSLVGGLAAPARQAGGVRAAAAQQVGALEAEGVAVEAALHRAREAHDPDRSACLDDLLSRAHAAAREGRALAEAAGSALDAGEAGKAEREMAKLSLLGERAGRLSTLCEGKSTEPANRTTVVFIAPALPDAPEYP
jgi:hypothetical protein